jgi:hypothetical protein
MRAELKAIADRVSAERKVAERNAKELVARLDYESGRALAERLCLRAQRAAAAGLYSVSANISFEQHLCEAFKRGVESASRDLKVEYGSDGHNCFTVTLAWE